MVNSSLQVHCVCGGFGFPVGTASSNRIMLIGRALRSEGISFHVWHIGPSSFPDNIHKRGEHSGITWEYLSPSIRRPNSRWLRLLFYLYGCFLLPFYLTPFRRKICIYLYYQGDVIDLWTLLVCRLLNIPVVQECCEWWPGTTEETRFNRWMYNRIMFRWSTGAFPISNLIEGRIRDVACTNYAVLKVPVLVDADEVQKQCDNEPESQWIRKPYIFWCGMVDGYQRDPHFLIRILGKLGTQYGCWPYLVLCGPCSDSVRRELFEAVKKNGLDVDQVVIAGFVPQTELFRLVTHAKVLLLPLWNDERSKSRFPTKMGLYVAAGRPIVSSPIGEIANYLQDGHSALFAPVDDEMAWADCINRLVKDEALCERTARKARSDVLPRVEYRDVGPSLRGFFSNLLP